MRPQPLSWLAALAVVLVLSACSRTEETAAPHAPGAAEAGSGACGRVSVASMNWRSAELLAEVDKLILSRGFGCEVELVPGDTVPTLSLMMEKGQPDVAPEAWIDAVRQPLEAAIRAGRLHYAARALSDGGVEGWWIPKYVADAHPDIKTIDDALRHPQLFPAAENRTKGAVHNCPSGWSCQVTTGNAFRAWEAEKKGFVLVEPGSAAELDDAIVRAHERREGWLGYYWAPTPILGRYGMVRLDAGVPHDRAQWAACNARADCAHPRKNDWARAEVFTVITDRFEKAGGPAVDYLRRRAWANDTVQALLAWMSEHQASGADGAAHFLKTQPEVWGAWVTAEVAAKLKAAR